MELQQLERVEHCKSVELEEYVATDGLHDASSAPTAASAVTSNYRLVILDNPFEQWRDPQVQDLVTKAVTLRMNGYGPKYPSGVIPFDASLWFATHLLVCEQREELHPVMGFQRVTLERYRHHYAAFAPVASCRQAGCARHIRAMDELVTGFESRPQLLSYTGGFTMAPQLKTRRWLTGELSRLMVVLHYFLHRDAGEGHEFVTAPTIRFRVDSLLAGYGFQPLIEGEGESGSLPMLSYAGEKVRFMRVREFNRAALRLAGPYERWWSDRITLSA